MFQTPSPPSISTSSSSSSMTKKQWIVAGSAIAIAGVALTFAVISWKKDKHERKSNRCPARSSTSSPAGTASTVRSSTLSTTPKLTLQTLLGAQLQSHDPSQPVVNVKSLESNALIGIYFSAAWCKPCQTFTPKLSTAYRAIRAVTNNKFQIVYASSDATAEQFNKYWAKMHWLAIPYDSTGNAIVSALQERFHVEGVPQLVIIDAYGNLVTAEGRSTVESMGAAAYDHWLSLA